MPRKLTVSDTIVLAYMEKVSKALTAEQICKGVNLPVEKFNPCIKRLKDHKLIYITNENKYQAY